jgi:hypothetical protein
VVQHFYLGNHARFLSMTATHTDTFYRWLTCT